VVSTAPGQQVRGERLGAKELHLGLKEAVALALQHNINLEVSRLGLAAANEGMLAASGIFDPLAALDLSDASRTSPSTNELQGAQVSQSKQLILNLGLTQPLPTGGQLSLGWDNSRSETNSAFYFLNPYYDSGLNFSFSQPLLKGFGTDVARAGIEVARRSRDISRLQFEQIVITTAEQVEEAYWNLVYTRENLKVKQESLKLAQDLLDQTRTRVRIGTSAPIDIVQSEATVAAREQEIIIAEHAVDAAADLLKQLMGFENLDDFMSVIVPSDTLETEAVVADLNEAIQQALSRRLELRQREIEGDIGRINLLSASNATKPQLDLVVGYGYTGVNASYVTGEDGQVHAVQGGYRDALDQMWGRDYRQWSAGVSFSYPLGNNTAKATLAQRRFELASATQNLALQRQTVILDVRAAVRGLAASAESIAAAGKARELAERNLDAEQKKFANGMSTNYQVLQIQADLAAAMAAELQARVSYRQARAVYHVAIGDLLEFVGVTLKDEEAVEEPHTFLKDVGWLKFGHWAKSEQAEEPKAEAPAEVQQ